MAAFRLLPRQTSLWTADVWGRRAGRSGPGRWGKLRAPANRARVGAQSPPEVTRLSDGHGETQRSPCLQLRFPLRDVWQSAGLNGGHRWGLTQTPLALDSQSLATPPNRDPPPKAACHGGRDTHTVSSPVERRSRATFGGGGLPCGQLGRGKRSRGYSATRCGAHPTAAANTALERARRRNVRLTDYLRSPPPPRKLGYSPQL